MHYSLFQKKWTNDSFILSFLESRVKVIVTLGDGGHLKQALDPGLYYVGNLCLAILTP